MNNPNCGACGMLNSRGFCSLTACRFPVVNRLGTWQERILANKPPLTNADRIRGMSDEELAEWVKLMVCKYRSCGNCPMSDWCEPGRGIADWLRSPADKEVDNG